MRCFQTFLWLARNNGEIVGNILALDISNNRQPVPNFFLHKYSNNRQAVLKLPLDACSNKAGASRTLLIRVITRKRAVPNFPDTSNDDGRSFGERIEPLLTAQDVSDEREWVEGEPTRMACRRRLMTRDPLFWVADPDARVPRCKMSEFSYLPFFSTRSSSALSPLSTVSRLTVVVFTLTARTYGRSHSLDRERLKLQDFQKSLVDYFENECQVRFERVLFTPLHLEYN